MEITTQSKFSRLAKTLVEIGQTAVLLAVLVGLVVGLFNGTFALVAVAGFEPSFLTKFSVWYGIGIGCALFWPVRYRKNMNRKDIKSVALFAPFAALAGPLALLLCFPL